MKSAAAFDDKLIGYGFLEEDRKKITAKWKSICRCVVCCGYNAEQVTDEQLINKVVKGIPQKTWEGENEPEVADQVRQLFWECLNMHMADTRHRHEACADEAPRPINGLEREARREQIYTKYKDAHEDMYEGRYESAHCVEDDIGAMEARNKLDRYIGPIDCPQRSQETSRPTVRPNAWRPKAMGIPAWVQALQAQEEQVPAPLANISTTHDLDWCFKRRGLGFVFHDLLCFKTTEKWRRTLMNSMDQMPVLPGDSAPGILDILAADKQLWLLMSEECRKGIRRTSDGRPLEIAFRKSIGDYRITRMLMCRPRTELTGQTRDETLAQAARPAAGESAAGQKAERNKDKRQRQKETKRQKKADSVNKELQALRKQTKQGGSDGQQQGGKRRFSEPLSEDKSKKKFVPMPTELIGCEPCNNKGEDFCFAFNLGSCTAAKPGGWCKKDCTNA